MIKFFISEKENEIIKFDTKEKEMVLFKLALITAGEGETISEELKPKRKYKKRGEKAEEDFVRTKKRKINWRVIEKIRQLQAESFTSAVIAEKLQIPLEVVNKYWI